MLSSSAAGGRVVAVALLGDGQGHDRDRRIAQAPQQRFRILRRDQHLPDGADDLQAFAFGAAHRQGIKSILRRQRIAHRGRAQACADDAPAPVAGTEHGLGVHRLMRALERPDAEMDDAVRHGAAIVSRARDVARQPPSVAEFSRPVIFRATAPAATATGRNIGHQHQHDQHRDVEDHDALRYRLHGDLADGAADHQGRADRRREQPDAEVEDHDDAEMHRIDAERLHDGRKIGVQISSIGARSMKVPSTSSRMLIRNRNVYLSLETVRKNCVTFAGTCMIAIM